MYRSAAILTITVLAGYQQSAKIASYHCHNLRILTLFVINAFVYMSFSLFSFLNSCRQSSECQPGISYIIVASVMAVENFYMTRSVSLSANPLEGLRLPERRLEETAHTHAIRCGLHGSPYNLCTGERCCLSFTGKLSKFTSRKKQTLPDHDCRT